MLRFLLGLSLSFLLACTSEQADTTYTPDIDPLRKLSNIISIQDEYGNSLPGAQMMLGLEFQEELFFTANEEGKIQIPLDLWNKAMAVTIDSENYVRATYFEVEPVSRAFVLSRKSKERSYGVGGKTTGFGSLKKDKWADFSMVAPIFSKAHLIGFELSHVISNQMDVMTVYGQKISIPSNVSFPKQKENYGMFPVTLDKPIYRMPFYFPGTYQIAAIHGRFPFKKVVGKMRDGKSVFEVVNHFQFKQIGITEVEISADNHKVDLPINQIPFDQEKSFQSPEFSEENLMMMVSLNEKEGKFFPSGINRVKANAEVKTVFANNYEHYVLAVLTNEENAVDGSKTISSQMSIQLMPLLSSGQASLLDRVESPSVDAKGLTLYPPAIKEGVRPMGTYLSLKTLDAPVNPHVEMVDSQKQWDVYAKGWVDAVQLPEWPAGLQQDKKLRWEVMFLGGDSSETTELGPQLIKKASHVSRNTVDL